MVTWKNTVFLMVGAKNLRFFLLVSTSLVVKDTFGCASNHEKTDFRSDGILFGQKKYSRDNVGYSIEVNG